MRLKSFFVCILFAYIPLCAQVARDITLDFSGGTWLGTGSRGLYSGWQSANLDPAVPGCVYYTLTTANGQRNMKAGADGKVLLAPGASGTVYILSITEGYVINSLRLNGMAQGGTMTITVTDPETERSMQTVFAEGEQKTLEMVGVNSSKLRFQLTGPNNPDGSINISAEVNANDEKGCIITYHFAGHPIVQFADSVGTFKRGDVLRIPRSWRRGYVDYTYTLGTATGEVIHTVPNADRADVWVHWQVSADCPVAFAADEQHAKYHKWQINTNMSAAAFLPLYANATGTALQAGTLPTDTVPAAYRFAFVGDPYAFSILNAALPGKVLKAGSNTTGAMAWGTESEAVRTWTMLQNTTLEGTAEGMAFRLRSMANGNTRGFYINNSTSGVILQAYDNVQHGAYANILSGGVKQGGTILTADPVHQVVYRVVNDVEEVMDMSAGVYQLVGSVPVLPAALRRAYCTYSYDVQAVGYDTDTISAAYRVENAPFEFSRSVDDPLWYSWQINASGWKTLFRSDPTLPVGERAELADTDDKSERAQWAIVGDPYRLLILNRAKNDATAPLSLTEEEWTRASNTDSWVYPRLQQGAYCYLEMIQTAQGFVLRYKNPSGFGSSHYYLYKRDTKYVGMMVMDAAAETAALNAAGIMNPSNSTMNFRMQAVYTATFEVHAADGSVHRYEAVPFTAGSVPYLPANYRMAYKNYTYYSDSDMRTVLSRLTADMQGQMVYVRETEALPFELSHPAAGDFKWYYMSFRDNKYVSAYGPGPYPCVKDVRGYDPMSLWAFEQVEENVFRIYNRWYGADYILVNPYGDLFANNSIEHNIYNAPVLMRRDEAENKGYSTTWKLVQYSAEQLGFTDAVNSTVSLNVYRRTNALSLFYWDATLAWNSRIRLERANTGRTHMDKTVLQNNLAELLLKPGVWYGLNESTYNRLMQGGNRTAEELENILTDPDNYVHPSTALTTWEYGFGNNQYLRAYDTDFVGARIDSVEAYPVLTGNPVDDQGVASDAAALFMAYVEAENNGVDLHAQGLRLLMRNGSLLMSNKTTSAAGVYPLGHGKVALIATPEVGDTPWRKAVKVSGTRVLAGELGAGFIPSAGWTVRTVKKVKATVRTVTAQGDALCGKSIASLAYDFPVSVCAEDTGGVLLYGTSVGEKMIGLERAGSLPSGTPFIYMNTGAVSEVVLDVPEREPDAVNASDVFRPLYVKTMFSAGFLDRYVRVLTSKSDPKYWLPIDDRGNMSSLGFRKSATADYLDGNKLYMYLENQQAEALEAFGLQWEDATSGIYEHRQEANSDLYYDLTGIPTRNPKPGLYIHKGKKIIVK